MMATLVCTSVVFGSEFNGDVRENYTYTQEDIAKDQEKIEQYLGGKAQNRTANYYKALNVRYFEQENGYYCGPATVKQVLNYINDNSNSQDFYANELGTTSNGTVMSVIDDVLNDYQSDNQYIMSRVSNRGAFLDRIESSLDNYTPAVIDIDTRYVSWPYSTSGHFVNISGLDTDSNVNGEIRITDPYWKKLGNHWYDIDVVYDAVTDHFNSAIIW